MKHRKSSKCDTVLPITELQRNETTINNTYNRTFKTSIAHNNLEKQITNHGITRTIERIKDSLVRLTKNYSGQKLEEVSACIIKEKLFAFIRCPENQPLSTSSHKCHAEWHTLTSCQASVIFSCHPKNKVVLFHDFAFGVDDIWVSKDEAGEPGAKEVTEEEVYDMKPNQSELNTLKDKIINETTASRNARIKEHTDHYASLLRSKFPKNSISRENVIKKIVYHFEKIAYLQAQRKQPLSMESYIRVDRKERNKKIKPNK